MRLKTQLAAAAILVVAAGLVWSKGPLSSGPADTDGDGKIRYALTVTSTEENVFVTGAAHTGKQGRIFRYESQPKVEPWHIEFVTDADDRVVIELAPHAISHVPPGSKVWVQCRIVVDGVEKKKSRDERVARKSSTTVASYCVYSS